MIPFSGSKIRPLIMFASYVLIAHGVAVADDAIQNNLKSKNWAGYAIQTPTSNDALTSISGSWTVPTISAQPGNTYSGIWVGLDGFNSSTVEQIGILADYVSGAPEYYAFYELYPDAAIQINTASNSSPFVITPGDAMSASVTYNSSSDSNDNYTLSINDMTSGLSYSISLDSDSIEARSSAEWIVEAPLVGGNVAALANFGSVTFTDASATLDGDQTGGISSLLNTAIDINPQSGLGATTSALDETGTSFTVVNVVPEPAPLAFFALLGLPMLRRRRNLFA